MTVGDREIFGPVTCIKRVKDYEEGIKIMNANPFANVPASSRRVDTTAADLQWTLTAEW